MQETNRQHIIKTDAEYLANPGEDVLVKANNSIAASAKKCTDKVLKETLQVAFNGMKCGYYRSDN